jgi:hypothetical protein
LKKRAKREGGERGFGIGMRRRRERESEVIN